MSSSSLFEDRKELWKWSQPYILVQISSFLCVFPPQWIHNDLNCTFIYISSYENLSVYSITANANQTETWVSYIFIHCYNCYSIIWFQNSIYIQQPVPSCYFPWTLWNCKPVSSSRLWNSYSITSKNSRKRNMITCNCKHTVDIILS